jgi:hypothetical protein
MLAIGPGLKKEPLLPILIIPKKPAIPEHALPRYVLRKPKLKDYGENDDLGIEFLRKEEH